MQVSLSRNVARATSRAERQAYLANANGLVLSLSALATAAVFIFLFLGDLLTVVGLTVDQELMVAGGLFFAAIPLLGLQTNYLSFLQGLLDIKGLATQRSLAVLIATAFSVPLVWILGLIGAATTFLIQNALLTILLGLRCRSLGYDWLAVRLNRQVIGVVAAFGLVSMAAGFAHTFGDTAIRASLLRQFGADANGLVQAPLVLAASLQAIVLGSVGSVSLATISQASSMDETERTMDRLLNVAIPISTAALSLLGLLGVPAIVALYSEEFVASAKLLPWILSANLIVVIVWVVGAPLLAFGDRAAWLTLELVWATTRWGLSVALLPMYGPTAVGIGMLLAVILHLVFILLIIRSRHHLSVGWKHGAQFLLGLVVVGVTASIGAELTSSAPAMTAAALIWIVYAAFVVRTTPVMARIRSVISRQ